MADKKKAVKKKKDRSIAEILGDNVDLSFVDRIINKESYPSLDNGDGTHSSHSMAWGEIDGKYVVFPTVLMTETGDLKRYDPKDAFGRTQDTGNFIEFDTPEEAEYFSENYKEVWGPEYKVPPKK